MSSIDSVSTGRPPASVTPEVRQRIADLRKDRRPWRGIADLLSTYALIALGFWFLFKPSNWVAYPITFLMVGMMQYRLVMSSHEAVHKTLLSPLWLNETFGSLNAALVGISFFNYRKTHLEHHKSPLYIREDTDAYIYRPLLLSRPGWPRLALLLFGVWLDVYVKLMRKVRGAKPEQQAVPSGGDSQLWLISAVQISLLGFFSFVFHWYDYFIFWFAPIFVIALTMDRIRTFVEHGYHYLFSQGADNVDVALQATVDIQTNPIEAYFLAPFGFDYHQAHHNQLTVPYYNLHKLSRLLLTHDSRYNSIVRGSYLGILTRMIWASK